MRWLPGDLVLIWAGMLMLVVASAYGVWATPSPIVMDPIHKAVSEAIYQHVQQGVHRGAMTREEALLAFASLSGVLLALVGAVYRSAVTKLQDLQVEMRSEVPALRVEVGRVREDFAQYRGETNGRLDALGVRLDVISETQAQAGRNLIDLVAKNNETQMALLQEMQQRRNVTSGARPE